MIAGHQVVFAGEFHQTSEHGKDREEAFGAVDDGVGPGRDDSYIGVRVGHIVGIQFCVQVGVIVILVVIASVYGDKAACHIWAVYLVLVTMGYMGGKSRVFIDTFGTAAVFGKYIVLFRTLFQLYFPMPGGYAFFCYGYLAVD